MRTLIKVIEQNLLKDHDAIFTYVKSESESVSKNYKEIIKEAKLIALYLSNLYPVQSRILLLLPQGLDFISSFLGCLYAGMIAVPAYPLANKRQSERLISIVSSCHPSLALGLDSSVDGLKKIDILSDLKCASPNFIYQSVAEFDLTKKYYYI